MTDWRVYAASPHVLILSVLCAFAALELVSGGTCEDYIGELPGCVPTSSRRLAQTDEAHEQALRDAGVNDFPYAYGQTVTPSEAFSSQRVRVFPFGCGPAVSNGTVEARSFPNTLPGAYNVVTRARGELFVLGGVATQFASPKSPPFIAKLDSNSMQELWRIQLDDKPVAWEISGALALASDGSLIAVYGRHIVRLIDNGELDVESLPQNARVFNKTMEDGSTVWYQLGELPLAEGTAENSTAYAGFILMPGGTVITRSLHRKLNCTLEGLYAVMNTTAISDPNCGGPGANSTLVVLNGKTLEVIQVEPFAGVIPGRLTSGEHRGKQYVYVVDMEGHIYRFQYANSSLSLDSWRASAYAPPDGAITGGCTAAVPLGGWLLVGDSAIPAPTKYTLTAVWQDDPSIAHYLEPFKDFKDRVPDPMQVKEISWAPTSAAVDPTINLVYMADFMAGGLAAYRLTAGGFVRQWVLRQWSPAFLALVGPAGQRVLVSTNATQVTTPPTVWDAALQSYQKSVLIFRNATTGEEITRSPELGLSIVLPHVPGFDGEYFHLNMLPSNNATLTKLSYNPGQCRSQPGAS